MLKGILGAIKANKKTIVKRAVVIGTTMLGLSVVTALLKGKATAGNNEESEGLVEIAEEDVKEESSEE